MKKIVLATLLAVASTAIMPHSVQAQTAVNPQSGAGDGAITLAPAESTAYNNAIAMTDNKAKAAALETFLTTYPNSQVKVFALQQLLGAYYGLQDWPKAQDAADRLLQVDANNLTALTVEASLRRGSADNMTDATQKQAGLDAAAGFAQRGLDATKPEGVSDDEFAKQKAGATLVFEGVLGDDALTKKDSPTAIKDFKAELEAVPVDQTKTMQQDTYNLGQAYYQSTPPDYLNCAWYMARASDFAPEPYKTQMAKVATYCYKKYHGADDGYDAVVAATQANLEPPAGFSVKPAKTPAEMVADVIASTPDLTTLAISDRETVLQYGKPEDVAKMWDAIKDKTVDIPDATVVAATANQVQVAVSDDAVQATPPVADFTFNFTDPLKTVPAVGTKIKVDGTYDSYKVNPVMITMRDASIPAEEKKPAPVRKPPVRRPAAH